MADPIEARFRLDMNQLAGALDVALNGSKGGGSVVFTLFVAESGNMDGGRVNYISNGHRDDMIAMVKEWLARAEGRFSNVEGRA